MPTLTYHHKQDYFVKEPKYFGFTPETISEESNVKLKFRLLKKINDKIYERKKKKS